MFNIFIQISSRELQNMIKAEELGKHVPVGKVSLFASSFLVYNKITFYWKLS